MTQIYINQRTKFVNKNLIIFIFELFKLKCNQTIPNNYVTF